MHRQVAPPSGGAPTLDTALDELARLVDVVCGHMDTVDDDQVVRALDRVTATADRLQGARSVLIGRVAQVGLHRADGAPTVATWLAERFGVGRRSAGQEARQATTLSVSPHLREAVLAGQVSHEAAMLVGDTLRRRTVPGDLGQVEHRLVAVATDQGADGVRSEVVRMQDGLSEESLRDRERRIRDSRFTSMRQRRDGSWDLRARLPADEGAIVDAALRRSMPSPGHHDPDCPRCGGDPSGQNECPRDTYGQRMADGLVRLAAHAMQCETADAGRRRGPVTAVSVIVDEAARQAWIGGQEVSRAMAQRLSCDGALSRIVMRQRSEVIDVGRATRKWSEPQRRALEARDGGCRGPGCDRPAAWCDAHHIRWWRFDGRTDIDNGILLCHACHHLVHDDGWSVQLVASTGEAVWRRPDGTVLRSTWPRRIAA